MKRMNSWLIGGGHGRRWRGRGCFAQPQQGDAGLPELKKKKSYILNVGGGKSTTLEEVKEAQLLSSHTLPEHAASLLLTSSA